MVIRAPGRFLPVSRFPREAALEELEQELDAGYRAAEDEDWQRADHHLNRARILTDDIGDEEDERRVKFLQTKLFPFGRHKQGRFRFAGGFVGDEPAWPWWIYVLLYGGAFTAWIWYTQRKAEAAARAEAARGARGVASGAVLQGRVIQ